MIKFDNYYGLYFIAYLVFLALVVLSIKKNTSKQFLDLKQTNNLKGIFIIVIMLHHLTIRMEQRGLMSPFGNVGYLGVGVFLFISGYALTTQYFKKGDSYFKSFFKNKVFRIYLPFLISNVIIALLYNLIIDKGYDIATIVKTSLLLINVWNNTVVWYLVATILFYVVFYLVYRNFRTYKVASIFIFSVVYLIVCMSFGLGLWWYNTAFAFPIGCLIATYKDNIYKIINENYLKLLLISISGLACFWILSFLGKLNIITDSLASVFLIFTIVVMSIRINFSSKILEFLGKISYELFLFHSGLFVLFYSKVGVTNSISFIPILLIIVVFSWLLNISFQFKRKEKVMKDVNAESQ